MSALLNILSVFVRDHGTTVFEACGRYSTPQQTKVKSGALISHNIKTKSQVS